MVIRRKKDNDDWRDPFFDDFFDFDIEKEIRRMEEWMNRMIREFGRGEVKGPYVYGFSMRIGPDGKPQIQEFGNVPRRFGIREESMEGYREPLVDVMENDKTISITAEMPGVTKDDIELDLDEDSNVLTIKVDTPERKYYKEVELPAKVKPDSAKATYKNGILDVVFERVEPRKKKGRKIKVK
ncbi:Hsp20/alpha crystallin family [Aciduliprofundum boonei T469]|nr:Hsp20/alpha crystallin family [Aciduliprofundum boonei T469]